MIYLDSTITLQADLAGAPATSQPEVHVWFKDEFQQRSVEGAQQLGYTVTQGSVQRNALNGTTDVVICTAPSQSIRRAIDSIMIYNKDTAAVEVTVWTDDGSTEYRLENRTLAAKETLWYEDGAGWSPVTAQAFVSVGTPQATTSGTSKDFTIATGAKIIAFTVAGVSTNGTDDYLLQLGDAGGIENSGYLGASSALSSGATSTNYTAGFGIINGSGASGVLHGVITLTLLNPSTNTWAASGVLSNSDAARSYTVSGSKSLSQELTTVRFTTTAGTDAFDAGSANALRIG